MTDVMPERRRWTSTSSPTASRLRERRRMSGRGRRAVDRPAGRAGPRGRAAADR